MSNNTAYHMVVLMVDHCVKYSHFEEFVNTTYKVEDLNRGLDYVIRSKRLNKDVERAMCFYHIYQKLRDMGAVPSYPDPKNGCVPKKIHSLKDFIEYNKNSVFSFIHELEKYADSMA